MDYQEKKIKHAYDQLCFATITMKIYTRGQKFVIIMIFFKLFLTEMSYAHQGCINWIRNTVILSNIIQFYIITI